MYAPTILHTSQPDTRPQTARPRLRGVFENEGPLGPFENVPYLWPRLWPVHYEPTKSQ